MKLVEMKEVGGLREVFIFATVLSLLTSHPKCGSVSLKCFLSEAGKFWRKTGSGTLKRKHNVEMFTFMKLNEERF